MALSIRRVNYFCASVPDKPGESHVLLSNLAELGVNLLAFTAVPIGPTRTQLTIFPEEDLKMASAASKASLSLDGPHPALLVNGDDELGALASLHERLNDARINVYACSGVTDGRGSFGYVLYVRPEEYERAAQVLGI